MEERKEKEGKRRMRKRWNEDDMDIDEGGNMEFDELSEDSDDNYDDDSEEIKILKVSYFQLVL